MSEEEQQQQMQEELEQEQQQLDMAEENTNAERQERLEEIENEIERLEKLERVDNEIAMMEQKLKEEEMMIQQEQEQAGEEVSNHHHNHHQQLEGEEYNSDVPPSASTTPALYDESEAEASSTPLPPMLAVNLEGLADKLFGQENDTNKKHHHNDNAEHHTTEEEVANHHHVEPQDGVGEDDDKVLDLPMEGSSPNKATDRLRSESQDSVFEDIKSIQQHRSLGETPLLFGGGVTVANHQHESIDANVDKEFERDNKDVKQTKEAKQPTPDYIKMFTTAILVLLAMFGDVLFVMARDWLETRKSRPKHLPKLIEGNEDYTEENDYREDFMGEEERKRKEAILALQKRDQRMKLLASQAKSIPRMVNELKRKGRGDDAMSLLLKNVEERKKMYGKDHQAYAHGLTQVGAFVCESGKDLGTARKCYEEALQVYKRKGVQNKKYEALLLQNLAVISRASGNLKQAQYEAAQAIALAEEALGKDHPLPKKWKTRWNLSSAVIEARLNQKPIVPPRPLSTASAASTSSKPAVDGPPLPPNKPRPVSGSVSSATSTASHSKSRRASLLGKMFHR